MRSVSAPQKTSSTPPPPPTPADRLRAARLAQGLSQFDLAVKAGLSLQVVSLSERGARMTTRSAMRLAAVLGLDPAELMR